MQRRTFFTNFFLVATFGALSKTAKAIPVMTEAKELLLNVPNYIESESVVKMPTNPKHGALVHIIVKSESLTKPCLLICNHSSITGDKEPLVLDQLATIVFKYDAFKKDWIL